MEIILARALSIAEIAHEHQADKAGRPYIYHPLAVASMVGTVKEKVVAVLHDVAEDSDFSLDYLRQQGFGDEITTALELLTHDKEVPYMDYIKSINDNDLARSVKIADLTHNLDLSRLESISEKDLKRVEKYKAALELLQS